MNEMQRIPENWILWRMHTRKHDEVVTHIMLDGGTALLCGRGVDDMEFDDSFIFMPPCFVYHHYGRTSVVHRLCIKCLRKAVERQSA